MIKELQKLRNHKGFIKYLANTGWLISEKMLRMVVGVLVGLWVARYLGPENYGILSYSISFVGFFAALAKPGLDGIVVRNIVREPERKDEIIGTSIMLRIIGSLLLILFVSIALKFTDTSPDERVIVLLLSVGHIFMSLEVIDYFFQSQVKGKLSAICNTISLTVLALSNILFIMYSYPLIYFALAIITEQLTKAITYTIFFIKYSKNKLKNNNPIKNLQFKIETAHILLKDSWPLILAGIAIALNMRIDQVMLKEFLGNEEVGIYAAAVKIIEAVIIIPTIISQSIYPSFVNALKNNRDGFIKRISIAYRNLFYISLLLAAICFTLSDFIVSTLLGPDYIESVVILKISCILIVFSGLGAINAVYLKTLNIQRKIMNRHWINVIINLVLNYFFIPIFGVYGAMYSTVIAVLVSTVIYDLFDKELSEMNQAKMTILRLKVENI